MTFITGRIKAFKSDVLRSRLRQPEFASQLARRTSHDLKPQEGNTVSPEIVGLLFVHHSESCRPGFVPGKSPAFRNRLSLS